MMRVIGALIGAALALVALPVSAQQVVGEVVTVSEGARLERGGRQFAIAPDVSILSGDLIVTNTTGTVQLVFRDETRVVIGPGSRFLAEEIRMRRGGRAQQFTMNTLGGTFRILSGDSAKRVYGIRTPTTTMGVRGTQFDIAVDGDTTTAMVTFDGEVQMCGAGRRCYAVSGSCTTIRAGSRGVDPNPLEDDEKIALLRRQFPFTQSQGRLGDTFRTNLAGCGGPDDDGPVRPARVVEVPPPPPGEFVTPLAPVNRDRNDTTDTGGGPRSGP